MAIDAQPGQKIRVTLKSSPRSEAARKTLSRVFGRGDGGRKLRVTRKKVRDSQTWRHQRGGRPWAVRPKAPRLYQPENGDTCEVLATTALLRDLGSVSRYVDVKSV
ncbi:MAG TPA: hypothetical protein VNT79_05715 [Phycisphaerae bacterium]|nr:hypothetical protein [Phycisphaerae bacterium]